jgi:hypothetical protein
MNRARLYLWSLLHSLEHVNEGVLSELADEATADLPIANPELRRRDMEAAVGAWAERTDLPDSLSYVSAMRNDARSGKAVAV